MLSTEHIDWNKFKIHLFLMETDHDTGGVCGHRKTIKLECHCFCFLAESDYYSCEGPFMKRCV